MSSAPGHTHCVQECFDAHALRPSLQEAQGSALIVIKITVHVNSSIDSSLFETRSR